MKLFSLKRSVISLFFILSILGLTSTASQSFFWGVNGHPFTQEAYFNLPIVTQLDLISELGANGYRFDLPQSAENKTDRIQQLIVQANRRSIKLFPILFPIIRAPDSNVSPAQIRAASFLFAKNIVSRYRKEIHYWELDNELETYAAIKKGEKTRSNVVSVWGLTDGISPEEFEENRYQKVKAELLGLSEGVKAADKTAKTMINAGWLHYGFMERLINEDKVPFDIISWHWYSEMGDIRNVRGKINLLKLLKHYDKPLIITEINQRDATMGRNENEQAKYLKQALPSIVSNSGIKGLFIYELLDEPYLGKDNPESYYGLVEVIKNRSNKWQIKRRKKAFNVYKSIIHGL
jgi:hypothetical protein